MRIIKILLSTSHRTHSSSVMRPFMLRDYEGTYRRVEIFSGWMSYIVLRGFWCNKIVSNVHAPSEEKSDDSKDCFYEKLELVFDDFPRYHMKIL